MPTATQTALLDGDWEVARLEPTAASDAQSPEGRAWMPTVVPGAIHYDLVRAGLLMNPLASRRAAADAAWVSHSDWVYRRVFVLESLPEPDARPMLEFESIDTYADIWLNGILLGSCANMFRPCHLPVNPAILRLGENELRVHVKAHDRMLANAIPDSERIAVGSHSTAHRDRSLIRRYQRSYNTSLLNLGENVIGIGIPGSVCLQLYPETCLADVYLSTVLLEQGAASVCVVTEMIGPPEDLQLEVAIYEPGAPVPAAEAAIPVTRNSVRALLRVPNPRLWWPVGYGEPHLYRLEARLIRRGRKVHSISRQVGIKTVSLLKALPNGRPTFQLLVNGREIYVRGGNLMPTDAIRGMGSPEAYERLLRLTLNANMNLIRLWGGGLPEHEGFLNRCDLLGIMIWQDFLYHSCTYPDYDVAYMAEAKAEAEALVAKMRRHACLVLLCGGNEQQQGWDEWNWKADVDRFYGESLITELLPEVCAAQAPQIPYIPNSPHGGIGGQSPVVGDTHTWGNYYNATKDPLFVTETCWIYDSYSRPETLFESMGLDVGALASAGWHRTWHEMTGLGLFTKFPFTHFYDISSLHGYLRALEVEQLEADHQSLAYLRFRSPSCNGLVYWPLNKGGPLFGFGCIDYGGRPLMAYYAVQRLFADVAIHLYRDGSDIRVIAANASAAPVDGTLRIWHFDSAGQSRGYWELPTTIAAGHGLRLFDLDRLYDEVVDRTREWVFGELTVRGVTVASAQLLFCPLAELHTEPGTLRVEPVRIGPGRWRLDLQVTAPTPLLAIEADRRVMYSDNYFGLIPGLTKRVIVTTLEGADRISLELSAWDEKAFASVPLA